MSWFDTILGYWGLPLILVVIGGFVWNQWVGLYCFCIWAWMWSYSFIKFSGDSKDPRQDSSQEKDR